MHHESSSNHDIKQRVHAQQDIETMVSYEFVYVHICVPNIATIDDTAIETVFDVAVVGWLHRGMVSKLVLLFLLLVWVMKGVYLTPRMVKLMKEPSFRFEEHGFSVHDDSFFDCVVSRIVFVSDDGSDHSILLHVVMLAMFSFCVLC